MPNNKKIGSWFLFIFVAPAAVISYALALLSVLLFVAKPKVRMTGAGILYMRWRPWVEKRWGYSTTLWRVIWFQSDHVGDENDDLDSRLEKHERVHIHQTEDAMFTSAILALIIFAACLANGGNMELALRLGEIVWASGMFWTFPFQNVTAIARYFSFRDRPDDKSVLSHLKDVAYRDAEYERSAYAQTDRWPDGSSWSDVR